jgi:ribosomal protein L37E
MEVEIGQLHRVNVATAGGTSVAHQEGDAVVSVGSKECPQQTTQDGPIFVGLPTFGHLSTPLPPVVPSTFMGVLGHNVGCIPGPIVIGNARIDTGLSHTELVFVGTKSIPKRGVDARKRVARTCRRCGRSSLQCDGAKAGRSSRGAEDCNQNAMIDGSRIVCEVCGKVAFDAEETCAGAKMSRNGVFQPCTG